jgi:catechol 2,3-dioxygenase-like lactoylglutathione lyase family enzyme
MWFPMSLAESILGERVDVWRSARPLNRCVRRNRKEQSMSQAQESSALEPVFEGTQPILRVADLEASVRYYVDALGFRMDFLESIASVSRGGCALFLVQGDQGHPGSWVWVGVDDVDLVHAEYLRSGANIRQPPTNFPWACEMQVEDLDGNVLRLGSESRPHQPFGSWRDMHGGLWKQQSDGTWRETTSA